MKVNFSKIKILNIDGTEHIEPRKLGGKELPVEMHKLIGNSLFNLSGKDGGLELMEIAQKIYSGGEVEIREHEAKKIIEILQPLPAKFIAPVKKVLEK